MEIKKRDCEIKLKFYDISTGWTQIKIEIDGKTIDFRVTYCFGDGIEDMTNNFRKTHKIAG